MNSEHIMQAAIVMRDAAERIERTINSVDYYQLLQRFEAAIDKFEASVERLIVDGPNPHD